MFRRLIFCLLLLSTTSAYAAPAPVARQPKPLTRNDFCGTWVLATSGCKWTMYLNRDGSYYATSDGSNWIGIWEAKNDVITIKEKIASADWGTPLNGTMIMKVTARNKAGQVIAGKSDVYTMTRIEDKK